MKRKSSSVNDLNNCKKSKCTIHNCSYKDDGWQKSLGCSLADQLDKLNTVQHLTTRQTKRLLRDVLTNENVVTTLRHYIDGDFREPETGEISVATRRKAKYLGLIPSLNDLDDQSNYYLQPRAITRSITRRIQQSLQGRVTSIGENVKQPSTILDMKFCSDDSDKSPKDLSSDDEYVPTVLDFRTLKRDNVANYEIFDHVMEKIPIDGFSSSNDSSESSSESESDIDSQDSVEMNDIQDFSVVHSLYHTRSQPKFNNSVTFQAPSEDNGSIVSNDFKYHSNDISDHIERNIEFSVTMKLSSSDLLSNTHVDNVCEQTDEFVKTNNEDELNLYQNDDDVYAEFLRTLFSTCGSTNSTPNKSNVPCEPIVVLENPQNHEFLNDVCSYQSTSFAKPQIISNSKNTLNVLDEDDPDDPEFDVMAELDDVNREDLFYELRDDRAVRVSKLETRNLHDDLRELFTDEDDNFETSRMRIPSVLVMKAHGQRFITEPIPNQFLKHSESSLLSAPNLCEDVQSSRCNDFSWEKNDLTSLQRQLSMHVQQLTTNFILSYDFIHLHQNVTRPCATLLKKMVCKRQTFDLLISQEDKTHNKQYENAHNQSETIKSFYWKCSILDQAVDLISDYAGLEKLPLLRLAKKMNRNSLSTCQYNLPIPICLLRIMLNTPIWSYPFLMPTYLGSSTQVVSRLSAHSSEDALLILALANYPNLLIQPNRSRTTTTTNCHGLAKHKTRTKGAQLDYYLITKYFLPHRTPLQLRTRRWNLVANQDLIKGTASSKPFPLATRQLLKIYTHLGRFGNLNVNQLQFYANELSKVVIPRNLPVIDDCLSNQSSNSLWVTYGLSHNAGYEQALNITHEEIEFRHENSEYRRSILSEFFYHTKCFFWSQMTKQINPSQSNDENDVQELVIKPDQASLDSNVLGPLYLPAIPVDMAPDGNITLSKSIEPSVIEYHSKSLQSFENAIYFNNKSAKEIAQNSNQIPRKHHIEDILERIRIQREDNDKLVHHDLTPNQNIAVQLADINKRQSFPLLPYRCNEECIVPDSFCTSHVSFSIPNTTTTISDNNFFIKSQLVTNSLAPEPIDQPLESNQRFLDCLTNLFYFGLDKLTSLHRGTTRKFDDIKPSILNPYFNLNASLTDQILTMLDIASCSSSLSTFTPSISINAQQIVTPSIDSASSLNNADSCSSQAIAVFPIACFLSSARFITRCRARGDATTVDLLTHPQSISKQKQATMDELDVRRARSLLDRCRAYLKPKDYNFMMDCLSYLNQALQNHALLANSNSTFRIQGNESNILLPIVCVLNCLKNYRALWEDFVCLLTPSQAQSLGILPAYLNLNRIGRIQRVFQDLVPRGKRFWRRLRNLADSCSNETRRLPVLKKITIDPNFVLPPEITSFLERVNVKTNPKCSNTGSDAFTTNIIEFQLERDQPTTAGSNKFRTKRSRNVRSRNTTMLDTFDKTWSVLESSWRNRPLLLTQLACLINAKHMPYSGFEESFEESDLLARHSLDFQTDPCNDFTLFQAQTDTNPDLQLTSQAHSFLLQGWDVCTDLSAAARRRRNGNAVWARRSCPCPCHPNISSNHPPMMTGHPGKPAKADSLGLRHCISCSLKVRRGIVYMDECNLHLKHVRITWPDNFKPKSTLAPNSKTIRLSANNQNLRSSNHPTSHVSTRNALHRLAELHKKLHFRTSKKTMHCESDLSDMAGRHISIQFRPANKPKRVTHRYKTNINKASSNRLINRDNYEQDMNKELVCLNRPQDELFIYKHGNSKSPSPCKVQPNNHYSETQISSPIWHWDDEAACFNTEAFTSFSRHLETDMDEDNCINKQVIASDTLTPFIANTVTSNCSNIPSGNFVFNPTLKNGIEWTPEEDRQLLEFCKAKGRYSSVMFSQLAEVWEPKPFTNSPKRTSSQLEARFKQLMRITLREAYDPQLFQTPYREDSFSSADD